MGTNRIGARFTVLPRRHVAVACGIAGLIAAAGFLLALLSPPIYGSHTVLSYDAMAMSALETQSRQHLSPAQLAERVLGERSGLSPRKSQELSASRIQIEETAEDPELATKETREAAAALLSWTPKDSAAQLASPTESKQPSTATMAVPTPSAIAHTPPAAPSTGTTPAGSEESKLEAAMAGLDARIEQQEAHLAQMRREGRVTPPASGQAESDGTDPGAEALRQRNEVEEKIDDLRKQRYFVRTRLEALLQAKGQGTAAGSATVPAPHPSPAPQSLPAAQSSPAPAVTDAESSTASTSAWSSAEPVFVLQQAATDPYPVADWRAMAGWFGAALGLLVGGLYLALMLWRFRPIRDESMLQKLLPKDIVFVGGPGSLL